MRPAFVHGGKGFTLIEILLTVAIFAIVLAAVTSVFYSALRLTIKSNESLEASLPVQHAMTVMKRDLEGMLYPGTNMSGAFQSLDTTSDSNIASLGAKVSPFLYTAVGKIDDDDEAWSEVRKVGYFLVLPTAKGSPGKDLVRSVSSNRLPVTTEDFTQEWLLGGVDNVMFSYYDGTGWIENWDSLVTTNLPVAVKVSVTFAQEAKSGSAARSPLEFLVPIMVQTRTNK